MNWIKQKKDLSKLNLIMSLVGVLLILIPVVMILLISFFSTRDPNMVFLLGVILITCSIPMIIIVMTLFLCVLISSVLMLTHKVKPLSNGIALAISIIAIIVCIVGTYYYIVTGAELIKTISRMG